MQLLGLRLAFPSYSTNDPNSPHAFQAGEKIVALNCGSSVHLFADARYRIALAACLINQLESQAEDLDEHTKTIRVMRSGTDVLTAWSDNLHSRTCRSLAERWSTYLSEQRGVDPVDQDRLNALYGGPTPCASVRIAIWMGLLSARAGLTQISRQQLIFACLCHRLGHPLDENIHLAESQRLTLAILTATRPISELIHGTILHCRERIDGLGQPYGIDGRQIPVGAQLLGLAIDLDDCLSRCATLDDLNASLADFLGSTSNQHDRRWLDLLSQTID